MHDYTVSMKKNHVTSRKGLIVLIGLISCLSLGSLQSSAQELKASPVIIESVKLFQNQELLTKKESIIESWSINPELKTYAISIQGRIQDTESVKSVVLTHIPSDLSTGLGVNSEGIIKESIEIENIVLGDNTLVIKVFSDNEANTASVTLPYRLISDTSENTLFWSIVNELRNEDSIILLISLLLLLIIIGCHFRTLNKGTKCISVVILVSSIGLISVLLGQNIIQSLINNGTLSYEEMKKIQSQETTLTQKKETLTKLDENGALSPGIAVSWSNISPFVWEMKISDDHKSEDIALQIQEETKKAQIKQLLSTVKEVIASSNNHLQFITYSPDPLLAQKLTQVEIAKNDSFQFHSENRAIIEKENGTREIQIQQSQEEQKEGIQAGNLNLVKEPHPGLWPYLFQNEYKVIPQVNTLSIALLSNRNSQAFEDPNLIHTLNRKLKSGAVLQTSYFQYGQLANQFASPGVTGFDPELKEFSNIGKEGSTEILKEIDEVELPEKETIIFRYLSSEQDLANIVEKLLIEEGNSVKMISYNKDELDEILLNEKSDLILIQYDFVLGDIGPFIDTFVVSDSPFNQFYSNDEVDKLIKESRSELNHYLRLQKLQDIMQIIVNEDPLGIPLLYRRSFAGVKEEEQSTRLKVLNWFMSL